MVANRNLLPMPRLGLALSSMLLGLTLKGAAPAPLSAQETHQFRGTIGDPPPGVTVGVPGGARVNSRGCGLEIITGEARGAVRSLVEERALRHWQQQVVTRYGGDYANAENASRGRGRAECITPRGQGKLLGYRCVFAAAPCLRSQTEGRFGRVQFQSVNHR